MKKTKDDTILATFRINSEIWDLFKQKATIKGYNASEVLKFFVEFYLDTDIDNLDIDLIISNIDNKVKSLQNKALACLDDSIEDKVKICIDNYLDNYLDINRKDDIAGRLRTLEGIFSHYQPKLDEFLDYDYFYKLILPIKFLESLIGDSYPSNFLFVEGFNEGKKAIEDHLRDKQTLIEQVNQLTQKIEQLEKRLPKPRTTTKRSIKK